MARTLEEMMSEMDPERRARIEARADEIHRQYLRRKWALHVLLFTASFAAGAVVAGWIWRSL